MAASSPAPGAGSAAPPSAAAGGTAAPAAGARRGGRRGAAWRAAAAVACAGWRRSAPGAPWRGRTAAGSASGRRAERPAARAAFPLQQRADPPALTPGLGLHLPAPPQTLHSQHTLKREVYLLGDLCVLGLT